MNIQKTLWNSNISIHNQPCIITLVFLKDMFLTHLDCVVVKPVASYTLYVRSQNESHLVWFWTQNCYANKNNLLGLASHVSCENLLWIAYTDNSHIKWTCFNTCSSLLCELQLLCSEHMITLFWWLSMCRIFAYQELIANQ